MAKVSRSLEGMTLCYMSCKLIKLSLGNACPAGDGDTEWAKRRIAELETQLAETLSFQNKEVWRLGASVLTRSTCYRLKNHVLLYATRNMHLVDQSTSVTTPQFWSQAESMHIDKRNLYIGQGCLSNVAINFMSNMGIWCRGDTVYWLINKITIDTGRDWQRDWKICMAQSIS